MRDSEVTGVQMIRRPPRSEEHTSELQSPQNLVCRLLLEKRRASRSEEHTSELQSPQNLVCRPLLVKKIGPDEEIAIASGIGHAASGHPHPPLRGQSGRLSIETGKVEHVLPQERARPFFSKANGDPRVPPSSPQGASAN